MSPARALMFRAAGTVDSWPDGRRGGDEKRDIWSLLVSCLLVGYET